MRGYGIGYLLKDALSGIRKNALMTMASVSVLTACLILLGSTLMITFNVNAFIGEVEDKNEIVVFIDDAVADEELKQIESQIKSIKNVSECDFVSKDQAFEEYKQSFGEESDLFEGLDNPLRNSYHIKVSDLTAFESTVYSLGKIKGIDNIRNDREFVNSVVRIRNIVSMIFTWVSIILLVVSLFIISNTVRLAMFTRKTEINIMKFVGATDSLIRMPFIIEGAIIGVLSAVIGIGVEYYIYKSILLPLFSDLQMFTPVVFASIGWQMFGYFVIFGMVCGIAGAIFPMRKYLKV